MKLNPSAAAIASTILELTVDATMESFSVLFQAQRKHLELHAREKDHGIPSGLPDALYCASILPAKREPSWSPVKVTQVPSTLLQKSTSFNTTRSDDITQHRTFFLRQKTYLHQDPAQEHKLRPWPLRFESQDPFPAF